MKRSTRSLGSFRESCLHVGAHVSPAAARVVRDRRTSERARIMIIVALGRRYWVFLVGFNMVFDCL